ACIHVRDLGIDNVVVERVLDRRDRGDGHLLDKREPGTRQLLVRSFSLRRHQLDKSQLVRRRPENDHPRPLQLTPITWRCAGYVGNDAFMKPARSCARATASSSRSANESPARQPTRSPTSSDARCSTI